MSKSGNIINSQKAFYDQLSNDYDQSVDSGIIEKEKKYRKLFDDGVHCQNGLDIGCGTGNWTRGLVEVCDRVTAIDSSQNMLDICRGKLGIDKVDYYCLDIFECPALGQFDIVFSTFWVSHVPEEYQERFWEWIAESLRPGGVINMLDSIDQGPGGGGAERELPNGNKFDIVKRNYNFNSLVHGVKKYGINIEAKLYGSSIYTLTGVRI